jgi:MFS family permease
LTDTKDIHSQKTETPNTLILIAALLLAVGFMASGFGGTVVIPLKMASIDGMTFYPIANALSAMGSMIALPMVGKLAEIFGGKKIVVFGVILQFAARILTILFANPVWVLAMFGLSAFGGGLYLTLPFALIAEISTPEERPKKYGVLAAFQSAGSLLGPFLAGLLAGSGHILAAFVSYAPFSIAGVILLLSVYNETRKEKMEMNKARKDEVRLLNRVVCFFVLPPPRSILLK